MNITFKSERNNRICLVFTLDFTIIFRLSRAKKYFLVPNGVDKVLSEFAIT